MAKIGRPKARVDAALVEKLAAVGLVASEIGTVVGCSRQTIEGRFREVLERGHAKRNGSLRRRQYELAMDGNATMLIWLGKQYLDQRDKLEHSGDKDAPVKVLTLADFYGGKLPAGK